MTLRSQGEKPSLGLSTDDAYNGLGELAVLYLNNRLYCTVS